MPKTVFTSHVEKIGIFTTKDRHSKKNIKEQFSTAQIGEGVERGSYWERPPVIALPYPQQAVVSFYNYNGCK